MPRTRPLAERFWLRVNKNTCLGDICGCQKGLSCCWPWVGNICGDTGYGRLFDSRQKWKYASAHRLSWELHYGPVPEDMSVLHKCDNRACVHPEHLFLGTQRDNVLDCVSKDRHVKGISQGQSKLTESDVHEILRLKGTMGQRAIAKRFNVSKPTIMRILNGDTWSHLTGITPTDQVRWKPKLTESLVCEILQLRGTMSQRNIAQQFGVSDGTISNIFSGVIWSHVTGIEKQP